MKKSVIIAILILFLFQLVSAVCTINVSMINQDPYPAIPGEPVKVVFQVNGISNVDCNTVEFGVRDNFPFTVDPSSENPVFINSGVYAKRYSSFYTAPFKIRVDENALDGDTPIEVYYSSNGSQSGERPQDFNIYIENTKADFEVYVKDYNYNTRILTFEILNIADVDVEALTMEIPQQENLEIKGANKVVVGDLDSNEYTTADFEAIMKNDGDINLSIDYTDSVNIRREINKTVYFDSSYFKDLTRDKTSISIWVYLIFLAIIGFVGWKLYKRHKKKKLHHRHH